MRWHAMRECEKLAVAAQSDALALSREADRRQRVLAALRTLIEARADLAKVGYALVPLEPTDAIIAAGDQCVEWDSSGGAGFICGVDMAEAYRAMVVAAAAEPDDPT